MEITSKDITKYRIELSAEIQKALLVIGWTQSELAEKYGRHVKNEPYSRARICQIVKCNRGQEESAEALLFWLNGEVKSAAGGTFAN
jgi:hypothetical protein